MQANCHPKGNLIILITRRRKRNQHRDRGPRHWSADQCVLSPKLLLVLPQSSVITNRRFIMQGWGAVGKVGESVMRQKQVEGVYGRQVILVGAHWCKDHFTSKIFGGQLI
jgi:hypothetical protein